MESMDRNAIKNMIRSELPSLLEDDPTFRSFVLRVSSGVFADKAETESRFDRILDEMRRYREEQRKLWDQNQKILESIQEEIQEIRGEMDNFHAEMDNFRAEMDSFRAEMQELRSISNDLQKENVKIYEEIKRIGNENQKILERLELQDLKHQQSIGALGARWGLQSEGAFRDGLKAILEKSFDVQVYNYHDFDEKGVVFGEPDQVELDIIIHDGHLILCEIKSSVSKPDLYAFWRKANFYQDKKKRKANRLIMVSPMFDPRVKDPAERLNIEMYGTIFDVRFKNSNSE